MKKLNNTGKWLLLALTVAWLVFIFFMSTRDSTHSSNDSQYVRKIVVNALDSVGVKVSDPLHIRNHVIALSTAIRKSAHITEFLVLALLFSSTYKAFKIKHAPFFAFSSSFTATLIDEYIQTFTAGRSGNLKDVAIDSIGVISGILLFWLLTLLVRLVIYLVNKLKTKKIKKGIDKANPM